MSRKQLASVINRALCIARSQSSSASTTTATVPAFFANRNLHHHHHRFFEEQENNNNAWRRGTFSSLFSFSENKFRTKEISMRAFARLDRRFVFRVAFVRAYFHFCPLPTASLEKKKERSPPSHLKLKLTRAAFFLTRTKPKKATRPMPRCPPPGVAATVPWFR